MRPPRDFVLFAIGVIVLEIVCVGAVILVAGVVGMAAWQALTGLI